VKTPEICTNTHLQLLREFNQLANMTPDELKAWLKEEQSESSGWSKSDGAGETIGHERSIIASTSPSPIPFHSSPTSFFFWEVAAP
jgi:Protein of unknown function (DUF3140)